MASGPAWKTASELADGYLSLNQANLKKFEKHELDALQKELDKLSREVRSSIVPENDNEAAQTKNRKLLRISQATIVLNGYRSRMGR
jgi:UV DNA damage repair endonuclease